LLPRKEPQVFYGKNFWVCRGSGNQIKGEKKQMHSAMEDSHRELAQSPLSPSLILSSALISLDFFDACSQRKGEICFVMFQQLMAVF
jgi:hypothetical protein